MTSFDSSADQTLTDAQDRLRDRLYSEALQLCTRALAKGTDSPRLRLVAAHSLLAQGLQNRARQEAQQVLRLDPRQAEAHRILADIARADGQVGTACEHLQCVLELDPYDEHCRGVLEQLSRWATGASDPAPDVSLLSLRVAATEDFLQRVDAGLAQAELESGTHSISISDSMIEEMPSEPSTPTTIDAGHLGAALGETQPPDMATADDSASPGWAPGRAADVAPTGGPEFHDTMGLPAMDDGHDDNVPTRMHELSQPPAGDDAISDVALQSLGERHAAEVNEEFGEPTRVAGEIIQPEDSGERTRVRRDLIPQRYATPSFIETGKDDHADDGFEDFAVEPASAPVDPQLAIAGGAPGARHPDGLIAPADLASPFQPGPVAGAAEFGTADTGHAGGVGDARRATGDGSPFGMVDQAGRPEPGSEVSAPDSMMNMLAGSRGSDAHGMGGAPALSETWDPLADAGGSGSRSAWTPDPAHEARGHQSSPEPVHGGAFGPDASLDQQLADAAHAGPGRGQGRSIFRIVLALTVAFVIGAGGFYGYLVYRSHKFVQSEWSKLREGLQQATITGVRQATAAADRVHAKREGKPEAVAALGLCDAALSIEFGEDRLAQTRKALKRSQGSESEWRTAAEGLMSLRDDPGVAVGYLKKGAEVYPDSALMRYLHGRALAATNAREGARAAYLAALKLAPGYLAARIALARLFGAHEATVNDAVQMLDELLTTHSNHVEALIARASIRTRHEKDLDHALADVRRVSAELQEHASRGQIGWAHLVNAQIERRRGQVTQMATELDAAIASVPCCDPSFYYELAAELVRLYRYPEALVQLQVAVEHEPKNATNAQLMARILLAMNRPKEARPFIALVPSYLPEHKLLQGRAAYALGRFSTAEARLREAKPHKQLAVEAGVYLALARARRREIRDALAQLRSLATRHSKIDLIPQATGQIYLWNHDYQNAEAALKRAWKLNVLDPLTPTLLGYVSMGRQDVQAATKRFMRALKGRPDYAPAHIGLAELHRRSGNVGQAKAQAGKVALSDRKRADYQSLMARVAIDENRFQEASAAIAAAGEAGASRLLRKRLGGELALAQGDSTKAVTLLQPVYQRHRGDVELAAMYGRALVLTRRSDDAYDVLDAARRRDPLHPQVLLDLGRIAIIDDEFSLGIKRFGEALESMRKRGWPQTRRAVVFAALAEAYLQKNDTGRALANLQDAIKLDPRAAQPHHLMGKTYDKLDRPQTAIEYYDKAIKLDENMLRAYLGMGLAYARLGDTAKATTYLKLCAAKAPNSAVARAATRALANIGN